MIENKTNEKAHQHQPEGIDLIKNGDLNGVH